jgi:Asp-tRNA(Asn)/Glu-tRNA(Gln) amidotransferase A subunit family amidase
MPVGVQIASLTWKDEKVLAIMKVLEDLLTNK